MAERVALTNETEAAMLIANAIVDLQDDLVATLTAVFKTEAVRNRDQEATNLADAFSELAFAIEHLAQAIEHQTRSQP